MWGDTRVDVDARQARASVAVAAKALEDAVDTYLASSTTGNRERLQAARDTYRAARVAAVPAPRRSGW